jgi:hypothetical protein
MFTNQWDYALPEVTDSSKGSLGALVQRLVNGKTLDLALRSGPMKLYSCPGEDDGRDTCAIHCADTHHARLRGFTVTGENVGSPPPSPPPPVPPSPPPPPFAASDSDKFNGCQDSCTATAEDERFCRDGGKGSYSPALCAYGTSCALCGPRDEVRSVEELVAGDDSCEFAQDGICMFLCALEPALHAHTF